MRLRNLQLLDIPELSKLHKSIFGKTHFSSTFELELLEKYFYELLLHNNYKYAFIDNEKINGYLIAGFNADLPVNKFFKNNKPEILKTLLFNPKFIFEKIFDYFLKFGWKKENVHSKHISVYLIAVDTNIQNKGIGKRLLLHFEDELRAENISDYTLAVRKNNTSAIDFYKKNNFTVINKDFKSISFIKHL